MQLEYDFEQLPLVVQDGARALYCDGSVIVMFDIEGEWYLDRVALDADRDRPDPRFTQYERTFTFLPEDSSFEKLVHGALIAQRSETIEERVAEQLMEEGYQLRSMRQQHSTLHYGGSGVL